MKQPLSPDLIRVYFGKDCKIRPCIGGYHVTMRGGGEAKITPNKISDIYGGADVHQAVALIGNHLWGSLKLNGDTAFKHSMQSTANMLAIDSNANFNDRGATVSRWAWLIVLNVVSASCFLNNAPIAALVITLLSLIIFRSARRKAKDKAQRQLMEGGFTYPQPRAENPFASHDDYREGGLL